MYIYQPDRFLLQKQLKAVAKYVTGKVLDVGAGHVDRYSKYMNVSNITRMDVAKGENVDVVGSADKIPFPDESFDSIICTQVFEHLQFPVQSTSEIYRVLKKGGTAVVTVPQMNELHEEPYDFFRYTNYGMKSLFENAGFETIFSEQRGGYYSMLAQIKIRRLIDLLSLYKRPIIGRILGKFLGIYGKTMVYLDSKDQTVSNRKHAIGWCFVFKK
jgi:SAM-dependent methyltransferase